MHALNAAQLLDLWERGLDQPLTWRMLTLLQASCPESSQEELVALPIGRRDARLLQLREWLLGPELTIVAPCPACGGHIESTFHVADITLDADHMVEAAQTLAVDGYSITFRLPASHDLLALSLIGKAVSPRRALLGRCVLQACDASGDGVDADLLPEDIVEAVAAQMSATDPQADVQLGLACPACDHRWHAVFDIASFLWQEIHVWAQRTLRDVHRLARAYGWREADVLALSPTRRHMYLELSRA